jgi:hypothetical protein
MDNQNLSNIKKEIDRRKNEKNSISVKLGERPIIDDNISKGNFLNELFQSVNKGVRTKTSEKIRSIENGVALITGEKPVHKDVNFLPEKNNEISSNSIMTPDRDELFFRDLEKRPKLTLSESISKLRETNDDNVSFKDKKNINNDSLVEDVKNIVDNHLSENIRGIIEETIKNTIIEMYALERIKQVITENDDLIEKIVLNTIRKIKEKNQKKA